MSRLVEGAVQRQTAVTAAPEATDRPLLKGGEVSDQVAQLRMQLNIAGADPQLPGSREYDADAIDAVKKFQAKHGLQADGQPGPKTWGMLDAIARDRVPDQDQMNDSAKKPPPPTSSSTAGDYDAARTLYRALYRTGNLPPEIRDQFAWNWAASEHHLGNYDQALSLYQEFLETPGTTLHDHRDALNRIQECRSHLPPRATESSVTEERGAQADKDRPEATDRPLLKGGEVSDQVAQLRMQLNIAGADPQLPPSREYDADAIEAVKHFQAKHGLQADGQPGPKTWGILDAIARDRVPDQDQMNDSAKKPPPPTSSTTPATTTPPAPSTAPSTAPATSPPKSAANSSGTGPPANTTSATTTKPSASTKNSSKPPAPPSTTTATPSTASKNAAATSHPAPPNPASPKNAAHRQTRTARGDGRPLLKGGEVSDQVAQLRMQLNIAGADPQLPGSTRSTTPTRSTAVKKFQAKHGLQADGQAGPKTWGMLDAIARDRVPDQDQMNDIREKATAADKLYDAGDYDAARTLYRSLYRTGNLPPEIRSQFVWNWAASEHHLGNYDQALDLYQEFLETPGTTLHDHRDALNRIQECRSHLPPRATESSVTEEREKALAAG